MADFSTLRNANAVDVAWLIDATFDEPAMADLPRRWATRALSLDTTDYVDTIARRGGINLGQSSISTRGGLAPVRSATLTLMDDGLFSSTAGYVLVNDEITIYQLFLDGTETADDRIVLFSGIVEQHERLPGLWRLILKDRTKTLLERVFPVSALDPARFPFAFGIGEIIPVPFGELGKDSLMPCVVTDQFGGPLVSPSNGRATVSSLWQWYSPGVLARVLEYAIIASDDPAEFIVQSPKRETILRAFRTHIDNDIAAWRTVRDGDRTTFVSVPAGDALWLYMASVSRLGDLAEIAIEVTATGAYTIEVLNDDESAATADASGNHNLALPLADYENWQIALLNVKITGTSSCEVADIRLRLEFDDVFSSAQTAPQYFAEATGYEDDAGNYADGAVISATGEVLRNPVHQIEALIRDKNLLGLTEDRITHGQADSAEVRTDWHFDWTLRDNGDVRLLDNLAQQAGIALYAENDGFGIAALDEQRDPVLFLSGDWHSPPTNYRSADPSAWEYDYSQDSTQASHIINQIRLRFGLHAPSGEFRKQKVASGQFRLTGTCTLTSAGVLTAAGSDFSDVSPGEVVYIFGDLDYQVESVTSSTVLQIGLIGGGTPTVISTATDFWLGPNLSGPFLRSQQRFKATNPLGQAQRRFTDDGGFEAAFIQEDTTADLLIDWYRKWHSQPRDRIETKALHVAADLRLGDVILYDHPRMRASLRPQEVSTLAADATAVAGTLIVDDASGFQSDDWLLLYGGHRPEVMQVASINYGLSQLSVTRELLGTERLAHADGASVLRCETKWLVSALRPMQPQDPVVNLTLEQMPAFYRRIGRVVAAGYDDYTAATDTERRRAGFATYSNGLADQSDEDSDVSHVGPSTAL